MCFGFGVREENVQAGQLFGGRTTWNGGFGLGRFPSKLISTSYTFAPLGLSLSQDPLKFLFLPGPLIHVLLWELG
jgi:hypothetical protein